MPLSYMTQCSMDCRIPCPPSHDWRTPHTLFTIPVKSLCAMWIKGVVHSFVKPHLSVWLRLALLFQVLFNLCYRLLCIWEKGERCHFKKIQVLSCFCIALCRKNRAEVYSHGTCSTARCGTGQHVHDVHKLTFICTSSLIAVLCSWVQYCELYRLKM